MIEKEQAEIKGIKEEIQKKGQDISKKSSTAGSGTVGVGAPAALNWADDAGSSGKKFKFIHVIIVSIVFLLLGSYLAKLPIGTVSVDTMASSTVDEAATSTEQVAKD